MVEKTCRSFVVAALMVGCAILSGAQEEAAQPDKTLVLHAARLLDVKTGTTLLDQVIVVKGDKISSVGPAKSINMVGEDERIEFPNATLIPGLIDCHVHLTGDPNELDLGPAALALVGMSSEADQRFLDEMLSIRSPDEYAVAMLLRRRVDWAVAELGRTGAAAQEGER